MSTVPHLSHAVTRAPFWVRLYRRIFRRTTTQRRWR